MHISTMQLYACKSLLVVFCRAFYPLFCLFWSRSLSLSCSHTSPSHPHPHPRKDTLPASLPVSLTPASPLQPLQLHFFHILLGRRCSSDPRSETFFAWMLSSLIRPCSPTLLLPVEVPWFPASSASRRTGRSPRREAPCWEWTCVSLGVRCWSCCG